MRYEELKTEYFELLMGLVEMYVRDNQPKGYAALCHLLHDYSFIPIIPFDENRCGDCSDLRHEFSDEYGDMLDSILPATGTMLELMVVLVGILDYNTIGSRYERSKDRWFLELLENTGLIKFNNNLIAILPEEFIKLKVIGVLENLNYRHSRLVESGSHC